MKACVTSKILSKDTSGKTVPFEETLQFVKQAGFEEIDMGLEAPALTGPGWESALYDRIRLCEREHIRIRYAHMPYHYPKPDDAKGWEEFYTATCRAIDFAKAAGVDSAAIHPHSFVKKDYDPVKERAEAIEFLTPYQDYALRKGFVLCLENMRGAGQSADPALRRLGMETADVISIADELQLGVCWDTGHGNISGQEQYKSITALGDRLKMVHLNDNFAEGDIHLAISLGNADWDQIAAGLAAVGYKGSLNTEVTCVRFPEPLKPLYAAYMYRSVRWLEGLIAEARHNS
jgi:sugar phosphate isomerase/epimerase